MTEHYKKNLFLSNGYSIFKSYLSNDMEQSDAFNFSTNKVETSQTNNKIFTFIRLHIATKEKHKYVILCYI